MTEKQDDNDATRKIRQDRRRESLGLLLSELASEGVGAAVFSGADYIVPGAVKSASRAVGNGIAPHLGFIERTLHKACKLKGSLPDMTQAPHVRSEHWGRLFVLFAVSWVASMAAKLTMRQWCNREFKVDHEKEPPNGNWFHDKVLYRNMNKHDWKVVTADEGVHLGSLIVMNTVAAKYTDRVIATIAKILEGLRVKPQKASEMAGYGTVWLVPNALGTLAGLGVIRHHYHKKSEALHAKKIMAERQETAANPDLHSRA